MLVMPRFHCLLGQLVIDKGNFVCPFNITNHPFPVFHSGPYEAGREQQSTVFPPQKNRGWVNKKDCLLVLEGIKRSKSVCLGLHQIGRASCRERVQISVVAGSLKKKKNNKRVHLILQKYHNPSHFALTFPLIPLTTTRYALFLDSLTTNLRHSSLLPPTSPILFYPHTYHSSVTQHVS